jgi:hypothetical protein
VKAFDFGKELMSMIFTQAQEDRTQIGRIERVWADYGTQIGLIGLIVAIFELRTTTAALSNSNQPLNRSSNLIERR